MPGVNSLLLDTETCAPPYLGSPCWTCAGSVSAGSEGPHAPTPDTVRNETFGIAMTGAASLIPQQSLVQRQPTLHSTSLRLRLPTSNLRPANLILRP